MEYAIQGIEGAYSYEALMAYDKTPKYSCYDTFDEVFEAVTSGEVSIGILPIENSSTGSISAVYDLLSDAPVRIIDEIYLKISHQLMAKEKLTPEEVTTVYSHIQGYEQSKKYFKRHEHMQFIPYKNTALSAKKVAEGNEEHVAAVASRLASEIYGLHIIEENINDLNNNYTRFIVISMDQSVSESANKVTFKSIVNHEPGSLYRLLSCFETYQINMTKIESRPIKGRPFEYAFYVDFEGNLLNASTVEALNHIKIHSNEFKLLGNYQMGVRP